MNSKDLGTQKVAGDAAPFEGSFGYLFEDASLARYDFAAAHGFYQSIAPADAGQSDPWHGFFSLLEMDILQPVPPDREMAEALLGGLTDAPPPQSRADIARRLKNSAPGFARLRPLYPAKAIPPETAKLQEALAQNERLIRERMAHKTSQTLAPAQRLNQWLYQFTILNHFLPHVCAPEVLSGALETRGALYTTFIRQNPPKSDDSLPVPLEFLVAMRALRANLSGAGLSQIDLAYDWTLNLPSGQSLSDELSMATGQQMASVVRPKGGKIPQELASATPLNAYIYLEPDVPARLGVLGSLIVASTLIGLIITDPTSYWHRQGSGPNGRWHPKDDRLSEAVLLPAE